MGTGNMSLKTNLFIADDSDKQFVRPQSFGNFGHHDSNFWTSRHDLIVPGQDRTGQIGNHF